MKDIKVSVLIYVLNDHIHIEKCIRSVMLQSLQELEILLIDGGSTDGTLEVIQKLQTEDARIQLLESGSGVGRQFNTGLDAAKGKYVGICESDDYLLPDMYERQYAMAEKYQLDVLKANVVRFCERTEKDPVSVDLRNGLKQEAERKKEYAFPFALSTDITLYDTLLYPQEDSRFLNLGVNGFWSGLYNRDFLRNNQLRMNETGGASYQDITFSFLTELYAKRAYVMSEAFYCYRMDNPNSSVNSPKKISLLKTEYQLLKEQLKQRKQWEKCKEVYWKWRTGGYFWFYDNLSDEMKEGYLPLMYQEIGKEIQNESYSGAELSGKERELCQAAQRPFEKFADFMKADDRAWEQTQRKIAELSPMTDTVIFGTGNLGFLVNCYLEQRGMPAVSGIDNATWKWDRKYNGLMILSPAEGVKRYPKAVFLIANADHAQEMKVQLLALGVKETNILICDHYDLFLKKMLVREIRQE